MKIKAIYSAGKADVYNMHVAVTHDFAVANGVIVHNCYDELRYLCMANPMSPKQIIKREIPAFDPLELYKQNEKLNRYDFIRRM